MPNKKVISNFNMTEEGNTLTADMQLISKIFKNFYSNLAESLLIKLPKPLDKYNLKSVIQYYSSFAITTDFCLVGTTEKQILKIIEDIKSSQAAAVDKLLGRFSKDGADILAKRVSALFNLSISQGVFRSASKVEKLKPTFKKETKTDPSNYRPISLLPGISKLIEKAVHDQRNTFFI